MSFYTKSAHDPNCLELAGASRRGRRALKALQRRGVKVIDSNATVAGMNRLFDGENVKDTVKNNG
jgi:hypothetical protein